MVDFGLKGIPVVEESTWADTITSVVHRLPPEFSTIWISDHFQLNGRPWLEAWTRLSWAAATFQGMRVGAMVLGQNYRNPALLASMAATLQQLSGGRLILGLGAGWLEEEYRSYGYAYPSPRDRVDQLAEAIELIRAIWNSDATRPATYHGRHYSVDDAICIRPEPAIPILVGTNGPRALGVAARLADWWVWDGPWEPTYRPAYERLRAACEEVGRPMEELKLLAEIAVWMPRDISTFERTYEHDYYPGQTFAVLGPTPADVVREIRELIDVGVSHFAINFEDGDTVGQFIANVVPRLELGNQTPADAVTP